jgi:hypothetical protein
MELSGSGWTCNSPQAQAGHAHPLSMHLPLNLRLGLHIPSCTSLMLRLGMHLPSGSGFSSQIQVVGRPKRQALKDDPLLVRFNLAGCMLSNKIQLLMQLKENGGESQLHFTSLYLSAFSYALSSYYRLRLGMHLPSGSGSGSGWACTLHLPSGSC